MNNRLQERVEYLQQRERELLGNMNKGGYRNGDSSSNGHGNGY
jgi:hypothetical protein